MTRHASGAPAQDRLVTGDDLLAMGDIGPCELVDGRIVPMSPTGHEHGHLEVRLGGRLDAFVSERTLGWVSCGEVGIYTRRNPDRVRGADIVFISCERLPHSGAAKIQRLARGIFWRKQGHREHIRHRIWTSVHVDGSQRPG